MLAWCKLPIRIKVKARAKLVRNRSTAIIGVGQAQAALTASVMIRDLIKEDIGSQGVIDHPLLVGTVGYSGTTVVRVLSHGRRVPVRPPLQLTVVRYLTLS